ncbi:MAG: hypothetical protein ACFFEN_04155 [Candidatus Thorarchaeota archaeon]
MFKDMSRAALSLFVFGIYMILIGIFFLCFPELIFGILALPTEPDIASRILGMVIIIIAYYYIRSSLNEEGMSKFYRWTTHTRASVIIFLIFFAIFKLANPLIVVFGIIDLAGAIWTYRALHNDNCKNL